MTKKSRKIIIALDIIHTTLVEKSLAEKFANATLVYSKAYRPHQSVTRVFFQPTRGFSAEKTERK